VQPIRVRERATVQTAVPTAAGLLGASRATAARDGEWRAF